MIGSVLGGILGLFGSPPSFELELMENVSFKMPA